MAQSDSSQPYAILGIHGTDVQTVEGNVARVRFFLTDGKHKDEDIELPALEGGVPATLETYSMVMKRDLLERAEKLRGGSK